MDNIQGRNGARGSSERSNSIARVRNEAGILIAAALAAQAVSVVLSELVAPDASAANKKKRHAKTSSRWSLYVQNI